MIFNIGGKTGRDFQSSGESRARGSWRSLFEKNSSPMPLTLENRSPRPSYQKDCSLKLCTQDLRHNGGSPTASPHHGSLRPPHSTPWRRASSGSIFSFESWRRCFPHTKREEGNIQGSRRRCRQQRNHEKAQEVNWAHACLSNAIQIAFAKGSWLWTAQSANVFTYSW